MERNIEEQILRELNNKKWVSDPSSSRRNVYLQEPRTPKEKKQLKGKRPDLILYDSSNWSPLAIIEAKDSGKDLEKALLQAKDYAIPLKCPIIIACDGNYIKSQHLEFGSPLKFNGKVIDSLSDLQSEEILKQFVISSEINTLPQEIINSKFDLINIFQRINNILRKEGITAGTQRLSVFSTILFYKMISEMSHFKEVWISIKTFVKLGLSTPFKDIKNQVEQYYGENSSFDIELRNENLKTIISEIDHLKFSDIHTDIKGDAFEYFLQDSGVSNDLGQYFTPRHLIETLVYILSPKLGEKIYDPFCGTGGFLISTFKYLSNNIDLNDRDKFETLSKSTLYGRDINKDVLTLSKMNMILQGDGHSNLECLDSLASPRDHLYDCVVTNIPFSQKTDYGKLYYNGISKSNGDATCLLHCLRSLKPSSRMIVVVPEGFLFRKNLANVREFILKKTKLELVVSLPNGVFQPYTNAKTSILYFSNAHHENTQEYFYYYEVENDGYSLDKRRMKLESKSDLFNLLDFSLDRINDTRYQEKLEEIGFSKIKIKDVKNNNYIIKNYKSYNEKVEYDKDNYKQYTLESLENENIISIKRGKRLLSKNVIPGKYPVITCGEDIKLYHSEYNHDNCITIAMFGSAGFISYHPGKTWVGDCIIIQTDNKTLNTKFLYYCLSNQQDFIYSLSYGSTMNSINVKDILPLMINVPSIEKQNIIIEQVNNIEKIINQIEELNLSLQNHILKIKKKDNKSENLTICKISDLFELKRGRIIAASDLIENGKYPVYSSQTKNNGVFGYLNTYDFDGEYITWTTDGQYAGTFFHRNGLFSCTNICGILIKNDDIKVNLKYLTYYMNSIAQKYVNLTSVNPKLSMDSVKNIQLELPCIEEQNIVTDKIQIVEDTIKKNQDTIKLLQKELETFF
uniref:hypothetical protein n=1 Tax=Erythrolobus coxiae TaxID=362235 RepID=UPI001FCCE4BF|nr:hypothetical protein MW556_pgp151 [Erythrolobus coxiae]UNJ17656.1 hypothetical protein [Erythrolobus coxiae]